MEIPKGDGKTRPLGIPVVKDRIVQTALKLAIEPVLEAQFLDTSFARNEDAKTPCGRSMST